MLFNLNSLLSLELPFSTLEIDEIIKALPAHKSPGSYGFNNEFLKKDAGQ